MEFIITDSRLVASIDDNLLNDNHLSVFKKLKKDLRLAKKSKNKYSFANDYEREIFKLFFNGRNFEENPKALKTLYIHGYHYAKLEKLDEAIKCLELALEINPVSVDVLINMAKIQLELCNYQEAFDLILESLKYSYTLTMLMNSYVFLQKYYQEIGDDEMADVCDYLLDYFEGSVDYNEQMVIKAQKDNIPVELNPEIVERFEDVFAGDEILDLMDRESHIEKLDELYESLMESN